MIAPAIDSDALALRLDRLPSRLRDALTRELDILGRSLRDRFGEEHPCRSASTPAPTPSPRRSRPQI